MLRSLLLFSSVAAAMEIGLSTTGSGTAESQLSSATSTSTEAPETITEIVIPASELSSLEASLTTSPTGSGAAASPMVTHGPIYTSIECNSDQGRNCDRLPEQPWWSGFIVGNLVYGFTPTAQQNPWAYYTSFLDSGLPASATSSAYSCSNAWYTNYTTWLATAELTTGTLEPPSTTQSTFSSGFTSLYTFYTATSTETELSTTTISGAAVTETDFSYYNSYTTSTDEIAGPTTETIVYTAFTPYFYPSYSWSAQAPCCSACTIYGGDIEVMYWPKTRIAGNKTTVVNSAGFTFTSPSIYMALQTLAASDLCGQVGSTISKATTLSFGPSGLSTIPAYSQNGSTFTFYPYWSPTAYTAATFGTAACVDETTVTAAEGITATVTYNPCYPYISIPPQVQTADPLWATCTSQWNFVLYDPPYVISSVAGLGAFSSSSTTPAADSITSAQAVTTSSSVASAGPTVPTIAPTTTSTLDPTTATSVPVAPASTASSDLVDPSTSTSPAAGGDPGTSSSLVGGGDPTQTTSSAPADPANPSPSTSPVAVDPGTGTSSAPAAGGDPGTESTSPAQVTTLAVVTIGSSTITANSASGFVIGSTTLTPGGQVTVSGTPVSLASNGATIAIGSTTQVLATPAPTVAPTYVIGSQTLSAGGSAITVSGTVFSLQSGGSSVVVGGTTQAISALLGSGTPEYVVASGSQTLKAGGSAITVSGTVVSLQSGGSSVVIGGTTTEPLSAFLGSTTTSGLADIIATIGGFGTSTTSGSTSTSVSSYNGNVFTGNAGMKRVGSVWVWGMTLGAGVVLVGWL